MQGTFFNSLLVTSIGVIKLSVRKILVQTMLTSSGVSLVQISVVFVEYKS